MGGKIDPEFFFLSSPSPELPPPAGGEGVVTGGTGGLGEGVEFKGGADVPKVGKGGSAGGAIGAGGFVSAEGVPTGGGGGACSSSLTNKGLFEGGGAPELPAKGLPPLGVVWAGLLLSFMTGLSGN